MSLSTPEGLPLQLLKYLATTARRGGTIAPGAIDDVMELPGADARLMANLRSAAMRVRMLAVPTSSEEGTAADNERILATVESPRATPTLRRRRASVPRQIEDLDGYGLKPDPLIARTPAELVDRMRHYRIWAGDLTLRELVRRANNAFALSTLSKTLKEDKLPPLDLLVAFITACGGSDDDVQRWSTAWRQIRMPQACAEPRQALSSVTPLPRTRSVG
ncbi:hypothetical protein ACFFHJ_41605 [Planotetraspora thailandica]|uniref:hypothetical protein n=1 Tax=Planotetraspora thailandica TaxID=487172 RepID=UPI00194F7EEF|nr:hypothetical protein [Planotetraspora thailandica]